MNGEWIAWLLLTVAVGVGAVLFLALAPLPPIADGTVTPPGGASPGPEPGAGDSASAVEIPCT